MKLQLFYWILLAISLSTIHSDAMDQSAELQYRGIRAERGIVGDTLKSAVVSAVASKAMGGSFRQGFKAGAIASGTNAAVNRAVGGRGGLVKDTLRSALVSGITSKAMGGSARQGAKTGAVMGGTMGAMNRILNRNH